MADFSSKKLENTDQVCAKCYVTFDVWSWSTGTLSCNEAVTWRIKVVLFRVCSIVSWSSCSERYSLQHGIPWSIAGCLKLQPLFVDQLSILHTLREGGAMQQLTEDIVEPVNWTMCCRRLRSMRLWRAYQSTALATWVVHTQWTWKNSFYPIEMRSDACTIWRLCAASSPVLSIVWKDSSIFYTQKSNRCSLLQLNYIRDLSFPIDTPIKCWHENCFSTLVWWHRLSALLMTRFQSGDCPLCTV